MVMKHFRSQFLHLAEKLHVPCCFSISTCSDRLIPTSLGKFSLQEVHLMEASQIYYLAIWML